MRNELIVELADDLNDEEIKEYLFENKEILESALDLDLKDIDDRATLEGWEITNIEIEEDTIWIGYDIEYSAYYGCKDMDHSGIVDREINGSRNPRKLIFEKPITLPSRSTYDEI